MFLKKGLNYRVNKQTNILALKLSSFGYWQGDRGSGLYSLAVLCPWKLGQSLSERLEGPPLGCEPSPPALVS